ncbi:MAG: TonB-dependent receptor [Bryobacteraceae bacterium]
MTSIFRGPFTRMALLMLFLAGLAYTQSDRGTITGIVSDPSLATIGNARITAMHVQTNQRYATASTSSGNYALQALPIGEYRLEVEAEGFKRFVRGNIIVTASATLRVDAALELGSLAETVEVTAEAPPLESETSQVSTAITNTLVQDLPLVVAGQIRNVFNLAIIAPEAKTANQFRLGGGQGAGWEMNMDGASLTSASANYQAERAPLSSVSLDAISEFSIETAGSKAEHGRANGVINFVTKSGTNDLHGSVYEYMRNEALDARGFFASTRPKLRQHDFGGTLGGPVYVPKLYDGRNKTFFFFNYEGFRNREGAQPSFNTVPFPEMYEGDFQRWVNTDGSVRQLYDPSTTRSNPNGSGFIRDPFPNNRIPVARFDAVARNYLDIRPQEMAPNRPGIVNNYFRQEGAFTRPWNKWSIKLDHRISDKDQFSFLYHRGHWQDLFLNNNPPGLPLPFNGNSTWNRENKSARWTWNRTVSNRILNSLRVLYQDEDGQITTATAEDPDAGWGARVGILNSAPEDRGLPQINMDDYTSWSGAAWGFDRGFQTHISDDVSIVTGNHTIKFGGSYQWDRWDGGGQHTSNGQFGFSYLATAVPGDQSRRSGNAFASFLLGRVSQTNLQTTRDVVQTWKHWAGYIQDDWRITPQFTLNIGVRYEYTFPVIGGAKVDGKASGFSNFSPITPNPGAGGLPGASIFSGDRPGSTGTSRLFDGYPWAFAPRLGLAWSVRPTTVIRASLGRSFAAIKTTAGSTHFDGFILNQTWASNDQNINDFPTILQDGLPHWNPPPFLVPDIVNGSAVEFWQQSDTGRPPEFWSASLDIQQQLVGNSVLTVGYRGTRGLFLTSGLLNINQIHPRYLTELGPNVLRSNINSAAARQAGIAPPYPEFNSTVQRALQAFPQYQAIRTSNGGERIGRSSYHALVVKWDKRYSNGITMLASYVLSKMFSNAERATNLEQVALDHYNRNLEWNLSADDQTHLSRFAFSYEFPYGRGSGRGGGLPNALFGGWGLAGFVEYASGTPMGIGPGICPPIYPGGCGNRAHIDSYDNWRAPIQGDKLDPAVDRWWNRDAFQQRSPQVLETVLGSATRRNPKVRTPWNLTENVSLNKNIPFSEKFRASLRFEAFNLFNRTIWGDPNGTVTAPAFGLITSQRNNPRQLQLGFKLLF